MSHTRYLYSKSGLCTALLAICSASTLAHAGSGGYGQNTVELTPIGTFDTGVFDDGAAEIVAYDPATERLFVVNGADSTIDVLDISDPSDPTAFTSINVQQTPADDKANSVAVKNGIVAAAVQSSPRCHGISRRSISHNHAPPTATNEIPALYLTSTSSGVARPATIAQRPSFMARTFSNRIHGKTPQYKNSPPS